MSTPRENAHCVRIPYSDAGELRRKVFAIVEAWGYDVTERAGKLLTTREIAAELGLHPGTVSRKLHLPGCPLPLPPLIQYGHRKTSKRKRIGRVALTAELARFLSN